ncbi:hypothetical protein LXM61_27265 [Priestia megaterium]|uniref:hypothetical protein n=1 Tax=Priestia megaterium TaxID=1404 RepID=UPI001E59C029|nr:hypothetical protein [Priestia megaterium]MCE4092847.1 hypothetical protein [Priestia megaterium]
MINKEVAIVSDGGKEELIRFPEGEVIVVDSSETFSEMPKGTKVFSPNETKELLSQNKIPTYKCNVKK